MDYSIHYLGGDKVDEKKQDKNSGIENPLKKLVSLKIKIMIISFVASIVFIIIFLIVLVSPLMELGIIDIEGLGAGGIAGGISYSPNIYLQKVEKECETIIVENEAYSLEEYVAGVVSAEAYNSEGIEALKAQAIAARSYAIVRTNNCQSAITNSSAAQNFTTNITDVARRAASETEGLVLTYDSEIILSEYDSFYRGGDYSCDSNGCSVTYQKLPNHETHKVSVSNRYTGMIAGGHGRGMSQIASYELANQGMTYDAILNYFYSPGVQIAMLGGSSGYSSGVSANIDNFTIRTNMPVRGNAQDDKFYFSNDNVSYAAGFLGQCTWYAFGRANEILAQAGSNLRWKYAPHAKYWLQYNIDSGSEAFSYSTDVRDPKPGAIIVWDSGEFGHVGVVEKVNDDGTLDYSEANISSVKSSSNPYGFRYQSNISYTDTGVGTVSSIFSGYSFVGYIYMVE